jgi:hypothetical protein
MSICTERDFAGTSVYKLLHDQRLVKHWKVMIDIHKLQT